MKKDKDKDANLSCGIALLGKVANETAYQNQKRRLESACKCYQCGGFREGADRGVLGLCEDCRDGGLFISDDDLEM